jgi:hypothetical protein
MAKVAEPDSPEDVVAYLDRRKCGACRTPLGSITVAAVSRSRYSPKFRCFPPAPTCWEFSCPGCGQQVVICVRRGKAWPLYPSLVSRRSPQRRSGV